MAARRAPAGPAFIQKRKTCSPWSMRGSTRSCRTIGVTSSTGWPAWAGERRHETRSSAPAVVEPYVASLMSVSACAPSPDTQAIHCWPTSSSPAAAWRSMPYATWLSTCIPAQRRRQRQFQHRIGLGPVHPRLDADLGAVLRQQIAERTSVDRLNANTASTMVRTGPSSMIAHRRQRLGLDVGQRRHVVRRQQLEPAHTWRKPRTFMPHGSAESFMTSAANAPLAR